MDSIDRMRIEVGGNVYIMSLDDAAVAYAEAELQARGLPVSLLHADAVDSDFGSLNEVMVLFAASLLKHHPHISHSEAEGLMSLRNLYAIRAALRELFRMRHALVAG